MKIALDWEWVQSCYLVEWYSRSEAIIMFGGVSVHLSVHL